MTYHELVDEIRELYQDADAEEVKEHLAIQFNISGEENGCFYVEIADGKIHVEPYEYYDRDAIISCDVQTLFEILIGKLTIAQAYQFNRIQVGGNLWKAVLLNNIYVPDKRYEGIMKDEEKKEENREEDAGE